MEDLLKPTEIIRRFGYSPKKFLGQHFLSDINALKKIVKVSSLSPEDIVLEVGSGVGNLTQLLARKVHLLYALEIDADLFSILKEVIKPYKNVSLIQDDALSFDLSSLKELPTKMVSNLPYQVAAEIIIRYLENYPFLKEFVVMVQKEVAERFAALRKSKSYSALTLKASYFSHCEVLGVFPPQVFTPSPKVDSALLRIKRRAEVPSVPYEVFKKLLEGAFSHRRKKMVNSLILHFGKDKNFWRERLKKAGIWEGARAEEVEKEKFLKLCQIILNDNLDL
jgi:16S rRNA (adenine1518-N6/adenine1519-N6)-dimethyltransferase